MNAVARLRVFVLAIGAALVLVAGGAGWLRAQESQPHEHHGHDHGSQSIWTCPMHPEVVESGPGRCPKCGMNLVEQPARAPSPRAAEASTPATTHQHPKPKPPQMKRGKKPPAATPVAAPEAPASKPDPSPPSKPARPPGPASSPPSPADVLRIDPVVVQNMGVRIATVRRGTAVRTVRTVGTLTPAEDRLSVVNLRYSGWIERIHVDQTGAHVDKGQALFDVYSPELVAAQQEYLIAVRTAGASSGIARSARLKLTFLGVTEGQIASLAKAGNVQRTLTVRAPRAGHVIHKNVVQGARVAAGADLYRVADLSVLWVDAEVYEADVPWVTVGHRAAVSFSYETGGPRAGKVTFIHPTLNPRTRTLQVRIDLANDDGALRPGMFATVEIAAPAKEDRLLIPGEAVIHSGTRQLVFVAHAVGRYEAREVRTGISGDDGTTEVLQGLREGERVVTSGQFLLDSESQLREAVRKMLDHGLHRGEGDDGAHAAPGDDEPAQGTYWTCPMHPQVVQDGPGSCPICGMDLVEKRR